jgi:peptidoglycan L-alanyl-D-glutamate endopeptidase CwlK
MGRDLNELASYFKPMAQDLLLACAQAGIPVRVVSTGRTPEEQAQKLNAGQSWTLASMHLPQPPEGKSEAIDIVPEQILDENKADWDPTNPLWGQIGAIGKDLGLEWGGDWTHLNGGTGDPSHFQYVVPPDLAEM